MTTDDRILWFEPPTEEIAYCVTLIQLISNKNRHKATAFENGGHAAFLIVFNSTSRWLEVKDTLRSVLYKNIFERTFNWGFFIGFKLFLLNLPMHYLLNDVYHKCISFSLCRGINKFSDSSEPCPFYYILLLGPILFSSQIPFALILFLIICEVTIFLFFVISKIADFLYIFIVSVIS